MDVDSSQIKRVMGAIPKFFVASGATSIGLETDAKTVDNTIHMLITNVTFNYE